LLGWRNHSKLKRDPTPLILIQSLKPLPQKTLGRPLPTTPPKLTDGMSFFVVINNNPSFISFSSSSSIFHSPFIN
jgi:hypothetical protein